MAWTKYNDGTQDYWYDDATGTVSMTDPSAQSTGTQFSTPNAGQWLTGMFTAGNGNTQPLDYDPSTLWQASDGRWYAKKNDGSIGNILDYNGTLTAGANSDVIPKNYIEGEIARGNQDIAGSLASYGPLIVGGLATAGAAGLFGGESLLGGAGFTSGSASYTAPSGVLGYTNTLGPAFDTAGFEGLTAADVGLGTGATATGTAVATGGTGGGAPSLSTLGTGASVAGAGAALANSGGVPDVNGGPDPGIPVDPNTGQPYTQAQIDAANTASQGGIDATAGQVVNPGYAGTGDPGIPGFNSLPKDIQDQIKKLFPNMSLGNLLGAGVNYGLANSLADKYIQAAKDLQKSGNPLNDPQRQQYQSQFQDLVSNPSRFFSEDPALQGGLTNANRVYGSAERAAQLGDPLQNPARKTWQDQLASLEANPADFWTTNPVAKAQLDLARQKFETGSAKMGTGGTQFSDYLRNVTNAASGTFNDQANLFSTLGGYTMPSTAGTNYASVINNAGQLAGSAYNTASNAYGAKMGTLSQAGGFGLPAQGTNAAADLFKTGIGAQNTGNIGIGNLFGGG